MPHEPHPLADAPARAILVEFLAAATCHGTNWDRLRKHLLTVASEQMQFAPLKLSSLTFEEFVRQYGNAFTSADDLPNRHRLFTDVTAAFAVGGYPFNEKRLSVELQRLGGSDGIYAALDMLEAFKADPQRKKSRILVQQLIRSQLIGVVDPNNLRPAIEYHLIRLYLRTGRVVHASAKDPQPQRDRATDVRSITALRAAVEQAMHYSAAGADLTIAEINEIEWQIGRSFCERERPRCAGPPRPDKPVPEALSKINSGACPFAATCDVPNYPKMAALTEPRLADHYSYY
jgi:hypothetical protein